MVYGVCNLSTGHGDVWLQSVTTLVQLMHTAFKCALILAQCVLHAVRAGFPNLNAPQLEFQCQTVLNSKQVC